MQKKIDVVCDSRLCYVCQLFVCIVWADLWPNLRFSDCQ